VNARAARLRAEVRNDREAIFRWLSEVENLELGPGVDPGTLAQAAWALHHAYSGIEAILERVMRFLEGSVPEGSDSHKELLDAAALPIPEIRPPLLRRETVSQLHELRAFRHFVRHAYAVDLDAERLADLQRHSVDVGGALEEDLDRLDSWLEALNGTD